MATDGSAVFYLGFVCLINFASCQFHQLDGIMKKHQKEKLQHLTTDGSTKVGNSASRVDSSGPSSRHGRALKLNGSHSLMRSFPGFLSIGDPPLPNCSPPCNQTSQIRRPTAVDEELLSCRQAVNNQEIVCIVDPRRRIRPEVTREIAAYVVQ